MNEKIPTVEEIIEKIKSRGFWQITIRPLEFKEDRLSSLSECGEVVKQCKVRLRGWDYPHISRHYGIKSGIDWVENLTDWESYKELWRMHQSGQFLHLFGCREDWWGAVRIFWSEKKYTEPGFGLSIMSTLYTFTEIYEFAARLSRKKLFDDLLKISVILHGMKNRRLVSLNIHRNLFDEYVCNIEKIPLSRAISVDDFLGKSNEYAIDDTLSVFERFNWFKAPRKAFEEEQDKFLKGIFK